MTGTLTRFTGRDRHAQEIFSEPVSVGFAPVRLLSQTEKTSVRSDSSASRGQAEQPAGVFKILVERSAELKADDRMELHGAGYRVVGIHPRYRVFGELDHIEVDLEPLP
jgi:hypothetical protein